MGQANFARGHQQVGHRPLVGYDGADAAELARWKASVFEPSLCAAHCRASAPLTTLFCASHDLVARAGMGRAKTACTPSSTGPRARERSQASFKRINGVFHKIECFFKRRLLWITAGLAVAAGLATGTFLPMASAVALLLLLLPMDFSSPRRREESASTAPTVHQWPSPLDAQVICAVRRSPRLSWLAGLVAALAVASRASVAVASSAELTFGAEVNTSVLQRASSAELTFGASALAVASRASVAILAVASAAALAGCNLRCLNLRCLTAMRCRLPLHGCLCMQPLVVARPPQGSPV